MAFQNKQVLYYYDEELTNYNYGGLNPMRPHRVRLATHLLNGYGVTKRMQLMRPISRSREDILKFHADGASARGPARVGSLGNLRMRLVSRRFASAAPWRRCQRQRPKAKAQGADL